jgi:hypothetical protein
MGIGIEETGINNFSRVPGQKNAGLPWLGPVLDYSRHR